MQESEHPSGATGAAQSTTNRVGAGIARCVLLALATSCNLESSPDGILAISPRLPEADGIARRHAVRMRWHMPGALDTHSMDVRTSEATFGSGLVASWAAAGGAAAGLVLQCPN